MYRLYDHVRNTFVIVTEMHSGAFYRIDLMIGGAIYRIDLMIGPDPLTKFIPYVFYGIDDRG